jgi:hypothetical protein
MPVGRDEASDAADIRCRDSVSPIPMNFADVAMAQTARRRRRVL